MFIDQLVTQFVVAFPLLLICSIPLIAIIIYNSWEHKKEVEKRIIKLEEKQNIKEQKKETEIRQREKIEKLKERITQLEEKQKQD